MVKSYLLNKWMSLLNYRPINIQLTMISFQISKVLTHSSYSEIFVESIKWCVFLVIYRGCFLRIHRAKQSSWKKASCWANAIPTTANRTAQLSHGPVVLAPLCFFQGNSFHFSLKSIRSLLKARKLNYHVRTYQAKSILKLLSESPVGIERKK